MNLPDPKYFTESTQIINVKADSWDGPVAKMQWLERVNPEDDWKAISDQFDVVVGKRGLAWGQNILPVPKTAEDLKKEGDMKTPSGLYGLCFAFGYAPNPPERMAWPYLPIDENFVGVDDPKSRYYNCIVNQKTLQDHDWKSAETMYRADGLYKWGIVIDYNFGNEKYTSLPASFSPSLSETGAGSQIFFHIWRGEGQGTEGCIAMPEEKMLELMHWLRGDLMPLVWIH